jgi:hypothetical protein
LVAIAPVWIIGADRARENLLVDNSVEKQVKTAPQERRSVRPPKISWICALPVKN